uniref:Uncharacterized protein n=1 Tax=Oryza glumipatula TaxID=40148 RepID=A0A0E0BR61_9ORYZ
MRRMRPRHGDGPRDRHRRCSSSVGLRALPEALTGGYGPAYRSALPRRGRRLLRAALLGQPLRLLPRRRRRTRLQEYNGYGEECSRQDGEEVRRGGSQDGVPQRPGLHTTAPRWLPLLLEPLRLSTSDTGLAPTDHCSAEPPPRSHVLPIRACHAGPSLSPPTPSLSNVPPNILRDAWELVIWGLLQGGVIFTQVLNRSRFPVYSHSHAIATVLCESNVASNFDWNHGWLGWRVADFKAVQ